MAQAYASLGSTVTLVELGERLIAGEEEFASAQVLDALRDVGVTVHLGAGASAARRTPDGTVELDVEGVGTVAADELLVAVGRRPLTDDLGLETVGLQAGKTVDVDDDLRVPGHDWLFAVGDVNGRALLTHIGKEQARAVADTLVGRAVVAHAPRHCAAARDLHRAPGRGGGAHAALGARGGAERHARSTSRRTASRAAATSAAGRPGRCGW